MYKKRKLTKRMKERMDQTETRMHELFVKLTSDPDIKKSFHRKIIRNK